MHMKRYLIIIQEVISIHYLHDGEIEAAIKSITFDERTTVTIHKKFT